MSRLLSTFIGLGLLGLTTKVDAAPLQGHILSPAADTIRLEETPIPLDTIFATIGSRTSRLVPTSTRAVQVITSEELALTPARSISDLFTTILGVDIQPRSAAQSDIALRGSTFEQVLVLVDGVRVTDAQTGHFDLDLAIPLSEIERIEIMRGPATALYGSNAIGGVIQIVTRREMNTLEASIAGGSFNTRIGSIAAATSNEFFSTRIAAEYRRSDGHRTGTDDEGLQIRASFDTEIGERTLRADIAHSSRDFGARAFYTAVDAPYDEYEETRTTTATLAWLAPASTGFGLEPQISIRKHDDDFTLYRDDPDLYRNQHTTWQLGGELIARYQPRPALGLAFGAEGYHEILRSNSLGDREEDRAALFAEATLGDPHTRLLSLGLRTDWYSNFGTFLAPSLAGSIRIAEPLRLRASVGRSFRAPSWTERYYLDPANIGDPDLDPERAWEIEGGADLVVYSALRIGITGFQRSARGLIDWARPIAAEPTEPWYTRNVSDARFRGLELDLGITDPLGTYWTAGLSTISLHTVDTGGLTSKYALRPLTRTATLAAEREIFSGLRARVQGYHAERLDDEGYTRADLRLGYTWGPATLNLDLLNATDTHYLDISGMPAPGRALFLGLEWGSTN